MTVNEMIQKWNICLHGEGQIKLFGRKPTKKQTEEIKAAKPAIIEELKRRQAAEAERKAQKQREREENFRAIRAGEKQIELTYHDGEYLSGWQVFGEARELLEELGLAKWVSGWGYLVQDKVVQALGEKFTYPAAVEYVRPIQEAKAAKRAAKEAERQAKIQEAKETGKPVLLRKWTEPCNDPHEECDIDIIYEYAQPDGRITQSRMHTW